MTNRTQTMSIEIRFDWKTDGDGGLISEIPMGRGKAYTVLISVATRNSPQYNDIYTASVFGGDGKLIEGGVFGYKPQPNATAMIQPVEE